MRVISDCFSGTSYGIDGVWEFRSGYRVVYDDDNKIICEEIIDERVKVSDSKSGLIDRICLRILDEEKKR